MFFKKSAIIIILLLALLSTATGDNTVYKSEHYTLTNPRITYGGGEARSEHYVLTNVQIGNIAGGEAKSEHYTLTAFPVKKRLPPKPPAVNPVPSPTNNPNITLSGTKDKNTSICVNGYEIIPINADTIWNIASYNIGKDDGPKILSITSKNKYNLESSSAIVPVTLDTTAPVIIITSPLNGATINKAPITVTGTIHEPCDVLVHGVLADVPGKAFTAENLDLRKGENTIIATAYDLAGNHGEDSVTVTSTATSDYNLTKLTKDIYEYDPTTVIAGSQVELTVKLEIDGEPAANEPIEFQITQGNGSIIQAVVNTNASGEAAGTLSTDVNANTTNLIEVFDRNCPSKKVTFHIDTKTGLPARLIKLTDENIHPVPGAGIELVAKLVDGNNNPIQGEKVSFQIISGGGSLSGPSAITTELGIAKAHFTTSFSVNRTTQIKTQLTSNSAISTIFIVTTSELPQASIDEVLAKVEANDSLIHDVTADIHVTSNEPWMAPESYLKIWIKGNKQKVEEISPNPGTYIRPVISGAIDLDRELLSYNSSTAVYAIKSKGKGQTEPYPYIVHYIDYAKGVIIKTEYHIRENNFETTSVSEYTDFIRINGAWGYQTQTDKIYGEDNQLLYTTTNAYSNIRINTGILDNEFQN